MDFYRLAHTHAQILSHALKSNTFVWDVVFQPQDILFLKEKFQVIFSPKKQCWLTLSRKPSLASWNAMDVEENEVWASVGGDGTVGEGGVGVLLQVSNELSGCSDTKNRENLWPISTPLLESGDKQVNWANHPGLAAPAMNVWPLVGAFNDNDQQSSVRFTN